MVDHDTTGGLPRNPTQQHPIGFDPSPSCSNSREALYTISYISPLVGFQHRFLGEVKVRLLLVGEG